MGKQSKSKKPECVGKGKVTPVQIAFIVDRYLSDNSFTQTRSTFRSEASHLIAKSPVQEAPKSLLSLGAILDEYITLKEQKVWMDQERCRLEQEKSRVQNLLSGMQNVMNAYNGTGNNVVTPPPPLPPPAVASGGMVSQTELAVMTPAGYYPTYNNQAMMSTSRPLNMRTDHTNLSTPATCPAITKRKGSKDVKDGPVISKRSRRCPQPKDVNLVAQSNNAQKTQEKSQINSVARLSACENAPNGSPVQGSNVVKCLFNQKPPSPSANSSVPKTPPRASSSQTEKSSSPLEICSTATSSKDVTPHQMMSANCTIISSETIRVSPNKQIAYYSIEKNHICSPLKRSNAKDHVKGRLDFGTSEMPVITENQTPDGNSTSESEKEGDILDLDFSNLDALGFDFNLSEFLLDFDIGSDELGLSSKQGLDSSPDSHSGSSPMSGNVEMGATQFTSQFSSTMSGFIGDNDMDLMGPDSVSAMRSVTKCITILSPVKNQRSSLDQNNTH
ncbi:hypothetical protein BUALT_Bualt09G0120500 [Buddleja alternifolia]|uniref:Uncharacterized protein n=1 Tax=Buddleja alternifolia TaxID=168488 RepID=A0AAV6X3C6_9LAMI|nr:hypothetical protein BUALT_Bualt09G0120500 [Buddleja alternifolia]